MRTSFLITSLLSLVAASSAALNNTREFRVVVEVRPDQAADLNRFNGLQISGYHSGAGTNDGVALKEGGNAFLNVTDPVVKQPNGQPYYNLVFDFGNDFPWAPQILEVDFYAEWLPVAINAGNVTTGALWYVSHDGLRVTSSPSDPSNNGYGNFLICDWFRGVPQLFVHIAYYNVTLPSNCANVNLRRHYI